MTDGGISKFIQKLGLGYTRYFNQKNERTGVLFQGKFKSARIKSVGQLQYLSCYINGNPEIHKICRAEKWIWYSYQDYLGLRQRNLCDINIVLKDFENIKEYKDLTSHVIREARQRKDDIKEYLLE